MILILAALICVVLLFTEVIFLVWHQDRTDVIFEANVPKLLSVVFRLTYREHVRSESASGDSPPGSGGVADCNRSDGA